MSCDCPACCRNSQKITDITDRINALKSADLPKVGKNGENYLAWQRVKADLRRRLHRAERELSKAESALKRAQSGLSKKAITDLWHLVEVRRSQLQELHRLMTSWPGQPIDKHVRLRTGTDDHLELGKMVAQQPPMAPVFPVTVSYITGVPEKPPWES